MESSDEEGPNRETLMEEAIKILNQEGFSLPGDVVDTLHTVGRSNAAARRRGSLRGHRMCEIQSNTKKIRNTRESSAKQAHDRSSATEDTTESFRHDQQAPSNTSMYESKGNDQCEFSDEVSIKRNDLDREESTDTSSTCSASTVKEYHKAPNDRYIERQDSTSSIESSASSMNRKPNHGRHESGSDTGYSTSIDNVVQTREAKAENLRNMTKTTENELSQKQFNGLRRDLSRDSGFTESGSTQHHQMAPHGARDDHALTTQDFNDFSVSNSDVSERFAASDSGEAHVVTSSASDMKAAQMNSKSDSVTEDGTAVSSNAKLENQESNSTLLRVTNTRTDDETSKEDNYESVNKTNKSSRNDSVSTTASGLTTAASRHAASGEQGLYKESSKLSKSQDGTRIAADMSVDQQLSRNQEMNNTEETEDGSSKVESKKTSEKALTSKSLREEKLNSGDGSTTGSVSSSQNMDSSIRYAENDETITTNDGEIIRKNTDSSSTTMNENNSTDQKTVKKVPYGDGSSIEIVNKSDRSSSSKASKVSNERCETAEGVNETKYEEDLKSVSSSFSGTCESEDTLNGQTCRRMKSTENSSESNVKSIKSSSSFSSRGCGSEIDGKCAPVRRLSEESDISNYSGISGVSKESVNPPTYDETMSNLSRAGSHGSLNSVFSRQDSTASSIASSASAFNERQRQKKLDRERNNSLDRDTRRKENDSNFTGRGVEPMRQDSFSSDSTLSGGNRYAGREIVHPIRKTDANVYGRSLTDSVIGQPFNRRATYLGDVSDRELARAREQVRSEIRGMDDSYLDDTKSRRQSSGTKRRDRFDEFAGFGASSFQSEVMNMVDKFFDDDADDEFSFGLGSRNRRSNNSTSYGRQLKSNHREDNPYTVRSDLSQYRDSVDANIAETEYAASDSGFPMQSRKRYTNEFDSDFSDVASDSGHNRFSRNKLRRDNCEDRNSFETSNSKPSSRLHQDDTNRYAHLSNKNAAISADDIIQRAGKSIRGDREYGTSISNRSETTTRNRINNNRIDACYDREYFNRPGCGYTRLGRSATDMNNGDTFNHVTSMPNDAYKLIQHNSELNDAAMTRSQPNISSLHQGGTRQEQLYSKDSSTEETEQWGDRRQRIDNALSWIRSELVRTVIFHIIILQIS